MNLFNQYSYIIVSIAVLAILYWFTRRIFTLKIRYVVPLISITAVGAVTGFILLQPQGSDVDDFDTALEIITNGKPTFLQFYSAYCGGCLVSEPIVRDIETQIEDEFDILRVDIHSDFGRQLRKQLAFSFTPEFVLFNATGQEVWRDHIPPNQDNLNLARSS